MKPVWTDDDIREILSDPIHCLQVGEREPIISEELWIKAAARAIKEDGAETFLRRMIDGIKGHLQRWFSGPSQDPWAMAYDFTNAPEKYLRPTDYKLIPEPVPSQHAMENNVTARWKIILPGDDLELYLEEQRHKTKRSSSGWRVLLPNGKIKVSSNRANVDGLIEGIAIARML
jgi:hypothetical protein